MPSTVRCRRSCRDEREPRVVVRQYSSGGWAWRGAELESMESRSGYCQVNAVEVNRCPTRRGRLQSGARRLVGEFGPVVLVSRGAVKDHRHDGALGGRIAAKLIADESPWLGALTLQQPTEEAFCCAPAATRLKENIDHVAVGVDCTPKIVPASWRCHTEASQARICSG